MDLPRGAGSSTGSRRRGLELMQHQSRFIESVRAGHRTFLLADEPGLGKTAQSLLAASRRRRLPAARRRAQRRQDELGARGRAVDAAAAAPPSSTATATTSTPSPTSSSSTTRCSTGTSAWLGDARLPGHGRRRGALHQEPAARSARRTCSRSPTASAQHRSRDPLLMALTGTPLINDIEDFDAIWQFLGWIDGDKPAPDAHGDARGDRPDARRPRRSTPRPATPSSTWASCAAARTTSRPTSRPAASPTCRSSSTTRSGARSAHAERELADRLVARYQRATAHRGPRRTRRPRRRRACDQDIVRLVAPEPSSRSRSPPGAAARTSSPWSAGSARRRPALAADYAAQLAALGRQGRVLRRSTSTSWTPRRRIFAARGLKTVSIRGDQTARRAPAARSTRSTTTPRSRVAVCSLTAAGVGVNLQAASNVVLAELSWTAAEQTQAIDRVHRIGQDEPVTAWRIIAAHTIDTKIAELIDSKQGLAARALDGGCRRSAVRRLRPAVRSSCTCSARRSASSRRSHRPHAGVWQGVASGG